MDMQEYLKNRVAYPLDELAKHRGEWVAWNDEQILCDSWVISSVPSDAFHVVPANPALKTPGYLQARLRRTCSRVSN